MNPNRNVDNSTFLSAVNLHKNLMNASQTCSIFSYVRNGQLFSLIQFKTVILRKIDSVQYQSISLPMSKTVSISIISILFYSFFIFVMKQIFALIWCSAIFYVRTLYYLRLTTRFAFLNVVILVSLCFTLKSSCRLVKLISCN